MTKCVDLRNSILAHGGDIRKEAPMGLILHRVPPKEFDQLETGSGDEDDEPISMGALHLASIQTVPKDGDIYEGEGQNEASGGSRRRRRNRRRGGAKAAETGAAAAGALAEEALVAARVARARLAPDGGLPRCTPEAWPPGSTTAMLRNIPNRYTAEELLAELLVVGFESTFDFFYLPIDFRTKRNRGYAFINFHTETLAIKFVKTFDKERLTRYTTQKILEITPAVTQGLDHNLARYVKKDSQRIKNAWFRPMVFHPDDEVDDASEASVDEAAATPEASEQEGPEDGGQDAPLEEASDEVQGVGVQRRRGRRGAQNSQGRLNGSAAPQDDA